MDTFSAKICFMGGPEQVGKHLGERLWIDEVASQRIIAMPRFHRLDELRQLSQLLNIPMVQLLGHPEDGTLPTFP
jgi:hypothetical protein